MFEAALKTNDNLHFAVLTGCLRVAKGSIFTGLNNFSVFSITDMDFDEYFGFTDMEKTVSIRDTFVRKPTKENFCHGMLLGILGFKEGWTVTSNKEAGDGFSDIMIRIDDADTGIIIEVKYADTGAETECRKALRQIDEKGYAKELQKEGIAVVLKYAIVCGRKRCLVLLETER